MATTEKGKNKYQAPKPKVKPAGKGDERQQAGGPRHRGGAARKDRNP